MRPTITSAPISNGIHPNPSASSCPLLPVGSDRSKAKRLAPGLRYQIANERNELHDAFALIYQSYLHAGLVQNNDNGIRLTPYHLLDSTEVFVTKLEDTVVSTISLIGDGKLGLPLESIYRHNVQIIRRRGLKMAEIGSLADRRDSPVRFIETFAGMGRLLAQVAMSRGYDGLVAATHPKHARLYSRILPFEQIGCEATCPYANGNPAVMLALVFDDHRGSELYERFFGSLSQTSDTTPKPWSTDTLDHFSRFLPKAVESETHAQPVPMLLR